MIFYFNIFHSSPPRNQTCSPSEWVYLNSPADKASGWGTKTPSIRWKIFAQPNINTVKNIDVFFSDLLPLELSRMKDQVHPWCKAISKGFCWELICCSGSTVAKQWVQEEGSHLPLATGTSHRLLHTKWHNTRGDNREVSMNHSSMRSSSRHSQRVSAGQCEVQRRAPQHTQHPTASEEFPI